MKITKCDRCSEEFSGPRLTKITKFSTKYGVRSIADISCDIELDICLSCKDIIERFVKEKLPLQG